MVKLTKGMRELLVATAYHWRARPIEIGGGWMRTAYALEREGLCRLRRLEEWKSFFELELTPEGMAAAATLNPSTDAPL
jgi:hypothetical protein